MTRTKPAEALSKILRAERIRLRRLGDDPEFQRDVQELEAIAKRVASASSGRFPVSKLSEVSDEDLLPTADEETFHDLAERFREKWGFQPRWTPDGGVLLWIPSPVSLKVSLETGEVIGTERRLKHHPDRDVDALEKYYRAIRKTDTRQKGQTARKQRRRLDIAARKLRARELAREGKNHQQIAKVLFPREYRDALKRDPNAEEKRRELARRYSSSPHNLSWPDAEKKAASELGLDLRPASIKLQKLTHRVRRYLGKLDG